MKVLSTTTSVVWVGVLFLKAVRIRSECILTEEFGDLFLKAVTALEVEVEDQVQAGLEGIGLGALGDSLPIAELIDVKTDLVDPLLSGDRAGWINSDEVEEALRTDLSVPLQSNLDALGLPGSPTVAVACPVTDQRMQFSLTLVGSLEQTPAAPSIGLLPDPLPALQITMDPVQVNYDLDFTFTVDLEFNTFSLGNIEVSVNFMAGGSIIQDLDILPSGTSVTFDGTFGLSAEFDYSSVNDWSQLGSFNVNTMATSSPAVASLSLSASDDNIFDTTPPRVSFDFDFCDLRSNFINGIDQFTMEGVLNKVLDKLDFSDNELFGAVDLVDPIKDAIVSIAEPKVTAIKAGIISDIGMIPCSSRRTMEVGVGEDGRLLQSQPTNFASLIATVQNLDGVESVDAGYFAGRGEIAVDLAIKVEADFNKTDFKDALDSVFSKLDDAKGLFDATSDASVDTLLEEISASVSFQLKMSFGMKVGDLGDMAGFLQGSGPPPLEGLFVRVETLSVQAQASASDLMVFLFPPDVSIDGGALSLSVGIDLAEPVETDLTIDGALESGFTFDQAITGQFQFEPVGHLFATLPLSATVGGENWHLGIIIEDENLFEAPEVAVKVDFDACQVVDVFQLLLAKLGSLTVNADSILGPSAPFSGIDLSTVIASIDDLLPDVGAYMEGVLEAKNELFHLCQEVRTHGYVLVVLRSLRHFLTVILCSYTHRSTPLAPHHLPLRMSLQ